MSVKGISCKGCKFEDADFEKYPMIKERCYSCSRYWDDKWSSFVTIDGKSEDGE